LQADGLLLDVAGYEGTKSGQSEITIYSEEGKLVSAKTDTSGNARLHLPRKDLSYGRLFVTLIHSEKDWEAFAIGIPDIHALST
jgi:hypothetical protein